MKNRVAGCLWLAILVTFFMIAAGVSAPAPASADEGQAPPSAQKAKPKEFIKVFCAERSTAQRNMMVMAVNCVDMCDNVYQEYPCELQQRLSEGWKVTSVAVGTVEVTRDPCECRVTGTESVLERERR